MIYLTQRERFSAAHRLWSNHLTDQENYATYGKCANPHGHGHDFILEVVLQGKIDPRTGMVIDLLDMKRIIDERIVAWVDHKHLNYDVPWLEGAIPTLEVLVVKFWERLVSSFPAGVLYEVTLYETDDSSASYRGEHEAYMKE